MKKISKVFLFLLVGTQLNVIAQSTNSDPGTYLLRVIPASPTAASLGLYGNTPVNTYTGTVNMSIPLYNISSGNLKLPITLNHHGGGIKVEEMASWVGLGWSLNAGGVITRTVRGIADDLPNGLIYAPMKVQFMIDHAGDPAYHDQIKIYMIMAGQGTYDTEPDIYYFNFGGLSGKFFYNQEEDVFYTIPRSNNKITRTSTGEFQFITENGDKYYFTAKEYTNSTATVCTPIALPPPANVIYSSISGWYLTKIENAAATDNITLDYEDNYYSFQTTMSSTGYIQTSSIGDVSMTVPAQDIPSMETQHCYQWPQITGKKLTYIHFKNGYLKFNANQARCDLPNDEALENVELYNNQNQLQRRFKFTYGYFGDIDQPTNCNDVIAANGRKLKLKKVNEENDVSGTLIQKMPYEFEYNESGNFPNRLSCAQDHWGYYNAANANTSLIPQAFYVTPSGIPIWFQGADRHVNTNANQIGSLTKIIYPTGGYTTYEYETNEVRDSALELEPDFSWVTKSIEGDHNGGLQTYYESAPFVINEPPNPLNGNNPAGGVFMSEMFTEIGGCGYQVPGAPATSCAVLNLVPLTPGATYWGPFTENLNDHYIANGTYKLTASFSQSPPGYADFYFQVRWRSITVDSNSLNSTFVGGLRIKKITDYDGIDHSKDLVKNFSYKNENNNYSSGIINGKPTNYTSNYTQLFISVDPPTMYCAEHDLYRTFIKRNSYSNYPLLTSSGSYVGYSNVSVTEGNNGIANGKTNYSFENSARDLIWAFPFPSLSYDWQRGSLNAEKQYKNEANSLILVSKKEDAYSVLNTSPNISTHKSVNGLKVGHDRDCIIYLGPNSCTPTVAAYQTQDEYKMPVAEEYETNTDYVRHISSTQKNYDQTDTNKVIISNATIEYDDLNYQPNSAKTKNSKQEEITIKTQYPVDYATNAPYGYFMRNLLDKNILTVPIEKYAIKKMSDGQQYVISGTLTIYKNSQPIPDKIYSLEIASPIPIASFTPSSYTNGGAFIYDANYKEQVNFSTYDANYNILEQNKRNDVPSSYVWDYNASFPIAECTNSQVIYIAHTSFEADGKSGFIYSGNAISASNAPTGNKVFSLSTSSISRNIDPSQVYVFSLWANTSNVTVNNIAPMRIGATRNGYTYYEWEINNASYLSIYGTANIDELRLYPKNALMTTYTYDPFIGITSKCDATNTITYFEYDGLGRLKLIRDADRNVLKKYCYNYFGQNENCTTPCTNFTPNWQNTTTPLRCQQGSCGNTGYQEQEQKDLNTCSSTYNQTQWIIAGYNPTACPLPNCVNLTSTNVISSTGYTASYYNTATAITYNFSVSTASGLQSLGTLPSGNYTLTISRTTGMPMYGIFRSGCFRQTITGTSAVFYNVAVSNSTCNSITVDLTAN
jgi:YD repeat-containing protein